MTVEELLKAAKRFASREILDHMVGVTRWAVQKGWDQPPVCEKPGLLHRNSEPTEVNVEMVATKLALIHSEISEALEELRKGPGHLAIRFEGENNKPEGMVVEIADAYIRAVHLCGMLGLDLPTAIEVKRAYNEKRPYRHGGKTA